MGAALFLWVDSNLMATCEAKDCNKEGEKALWKWGWCWDEIPVEIEARYFCSIDCVLEWLYDNGIQFGSYDLEANR